MSELVLPAFHLDCRDWIVGTPEDIGLAEDAAGGPLLAVLSTVVLHGGEFRPVRGVLTVGLLDAVVPSRPLGENCVAELLLDDPSEDPAERPGGESRRYLMPTPEGHLAVVADFELGIGLDPVVLERIETLMRSFRWVA